MPNPSTTTRAAGRAISVAVIACLPAIASAQVVQSPNYTLSLEASGLNNPQGLDTDAAGFVYVTDSGNGRILRGQNASYSPIITGITVAPFVGLDIGPLSVHIAPDQTLYYGEGGRATGVEQIHHHTTSGTLLDSLAPVQFGGNWSGLTINPATGRLLATSANGDRIFQASPAGSTFGPLTQLLSTSSHGSISPVGIVATNTTIYAAVFGTFSGVGSIASYDASTGALINAVVTTGLDAATGLDILPDGRLLVSEYGSTNGISTVTIVDPLTGAKTPLVTGLTAATGIAVHTDGSIYFVDSGNPNMGDGRLFKLTLVPAPATSLALLGLVALAPRRRR